VQETKSREASEEEHPEQSDAKEIPASTSNDIFRHLRETLRRSDASSLQYR